MLKNILGIDCEIFEPYSPGDKLGEIEAKVLNRVRAKNFSNAIRPKVEKLLEDGTSPRDIALAVKDADFSYELSLSSLLDPVEREAIKIATDLVKLHLAQDGRKLDVPPYGISPDEWKKKVDEQIEIVAELPEVLSSAKRNCEARRSTATKFAETLKLNEQSAP